jgi:hypothetical protein
MSKTNALRFNKIVDKFLTELQTILPDEKDIIIFKSQVDVTAMINPNKILNSFIKHVYPHKTHIMEKNEDFFLGNGLNIEKDYMSEAIHLSELWKTKLSLENKIVVWKYFQVMILLSEKSLSGN